jgi:7,8-dihydropterin-6-yl-methyl-4-(beta-D-ribofuranosyl)aminobenzene 5'-phosphate synthase
VLGRKLVKITTLIENTKAGKAERVEAEHGISLYVEFDSRKLLFDTGASSHFLENAKELNQNINEIDMAVISHGHFDHGGGLETFIAENPDAPIYVIGEAFKSYHKKIAGLFNKYIGLDRTLVQICEQRFVFVKGFTEVDEDVFIITDIREKHPRPLGNKDLLSKENGVYVPDDFKHELILVLRERDGLVVFTGCAHSGILNMVETVEEHFKDEQIKAVIGGFHLMNPVTKKMTEKPEHVAGIGRMLCDKAHLKKVFTGHCTGTKAYEILKSQMGDKLEYFATGSVMSL